MGSIAVPPILSEQNREQTFHERPIFSAYELGKTVIRSYNIEEITDGKIRLLRDSMSAAEVYELYESFESLDFIPVQNQSGIISGYVKRQTFLAALSQNRFARELILRPDVTVASIMDPRVVSLDAHMTLPEASNLLMRRDESIRFDPFVISYEGKYFGISNVRRVLDGINYYIRLDTEACYDAQQTLITETNNPEVEKHNIVAAHHVDPLHGPGGDYTASFDLADGITLSLLFDVCGKGLRASNMVMAIGSVFRSWYEFLGSATDNQGILNITDTMERLNRIIYKMTPEDMYATGVVMLIDTINNTIKVFDYGHGFIWLKRGERIFDLSLSHAGNGKPEEKQEQMPFFGINENYRLKPTTYRIKEDDILFTCSDGIIEAFNPQKEEFGDERILEILKTTGSRSPEELNDEILREWKIFREDMRRSDDLSLLSIFF